MSREYRVCHREHGTQHTTYCPFRDWGVQNWPGNRTDAEREAEAREKLAEYRRYHRIFFGVAEVDTWLESREVGPWEEVDA